MTPKLETVWLIFLVIVALSMLGSVGYKSIILGC